MLRDLLDFVPRHNGIGQNQPIGCESNFGSGQSQIERDRDSRSFRRSGLEQLCGLIVREDGHPVRCLNEQIRSNTMTTV